MVGSGADRILDPSEERRVPHFDRDQKHLVEREKDGDLDQDGQAPRHGVHFFLFVQRHHRLLLALLVVLEALLDLLQLWLQLLHLAHRFERFVGKREEEELHKHCRQQDRDAEIADELVEPVHQVEHRLGDEGEPSPVDEQVQPVDAVVLRVLLKETDHLRAREQAVGYAFPLSRLDRDRMLPHIRIELLFLISEQTGFVGLRLIGNENRRPILIGEAEPSALVGRNRFLGPIGQRVIVLERVGVGHFLEAVRAKHADQPLVEHRIAEQPLRLGQTRHLAPRPERDGLARLVLDLIGDREHVMTVDRNLAMENQSGAVVPAKLDRRYRRQRPCAVLLPESVFGRQSHARLIRQPARESEIGMRAPRWRQKIDLRAVRIDGDGVVPEHEVVDPAAFQIDGADQSGTVDFHARRCCNRCVPRQKGGGCRGRSLHGRRRRRRLAAGGLDLGCGGLGLLRIVRRLDGLLPGFLGGAHVKKLPADEHSKRKRNSEDKVSVVFHNPLKGDLRSARSRPAKQVSQTDSQTAPLAGSCPRWKQNQQNRRSVHKTGLRSLSERAGWPTLWNASRMSASRSAKFLVKAAARPMIT